MKRIAAFIARLGEDPKFIAFCAHSGIAYSVVYTVATHGANLYITAAIALALAALKEFAFDATQEHNPPQSFTDNIEDFMGYAFGIFLAGAVYLF